MTAACGMEPSPWNGASLWKGAKVARKAGDGSAVAVDGSRQLELG